MEKIDIDYLKKNKLIIFECISGSKAYGTNHAKSDTDIRGVFILPKEVYYSLTYVDQVNNESNDETYFELKRFVELLAKNNPNILELLNSPEDCILYKHPLFDQLKSEDFLTKLCKDTFAGYAMSQVKKARGLNKKIVNPIEKERKNILHFCYVVKDQGSSNIIHWLAKRNLDQKKCGLVNIPNMRDVYGLYYDDKNELGYKGIMKSEASNDVMLSSIPKGEKSIAVFFFNKDGYSQYCKHYKDYWEWVEKRNDDRYENTISHGKNYDAKNMMHTFRLLDMAEEIAQEQKIIVRRPNREFLLQIRKGDFEYEDLLKIAEAKISTIEVLYQNSTLPEEIDETKVNQLLVKIRDDFYKNS